MNRFNFVQQPVVVSAGTDQQRAEHHSSGMCEVVVVRANAGEVGQR